MRRSRCQDLAGDARNATTQGEGSNVFGIRLRRALGLLLTAAGGTTGADVTEVLPPVTVHASNVNVFATPMAEDARGEVFVATVEPPASGQESGVNLRSMIRHGAKDEHGAWRWRAHEVDSRTLDDPYHTQMSIGVDRSGNLHAAYNMHNMPWQYGRTLIPGDLASLTFLGEHISDHQRRVVKHQNRTPFVDPGKAALPGTQITYPSFFNDRTGRLFITYRFAARPEQPFTERGWVAGVARYDEELGQWIALGAPLVSAPRAPRAFAFQENWTPYLVRLAFDAANSLHAVWSWAEGGPQGTTRTPSYVKWSEGRAPVDAAGRTLSLPISVGEGAIGSGRKDQRMLPAMSLMLDSSNTPHVLVQSADGARQITKLQSTHGWSKPEMTPEGASAIVIDHKDRMWAVATGPKIFMRGAVRGDWRLLHSETGWCHPKLYRSARNNIYLYVQRCDLQQVKVLQILDSEF